MEEVPWEGSGILGTPKVVQAVLVNLQNEAELYGTLFKSIDTKCSIIHPSFLQTRTRVHTHTRTPPAPVMRLYSYIHVSRIDHVCVCIHPCLSIPESGFLS